MIDAARRWREASPVPLGALFVLLLFWGMALLILVPFAMMPSPATSVPLPTPPPTPPWDALPTRRLATAIPPTPTPIPAIAVAAAPLAEFHAALLISDLATAQSAWETALALAPHESVMWREGARLALAQDNLPAAEARIRQALRLDAQDAQVWALWGTLLERQGAYRAAAQAFQIAASLAPHLTADLFLERWRTARRGNDLRQMTALAEEYARANPDDPLTAYYQASVTLALGQPDAAIAELIAALTADPSAPGVLWYTLGEAYAARGAYREAAQVFEVAASRLADGDASLALASDNPLRDLNLRLARAYLDTEQCAAAEALLLHTEDPRPETSGWLEAAILCQTPTPTWTPWIIDPP